MDTPRIGTYTVTTDRFGYPAIHLDTPWKAGDKVLVQLLPQPEPVPELVNMSVEYSCGDVHFIVKKPGLDLEQQTASVYCPGCKQYHKFDFTNYLR